MVSIAGEPGKVLLRGLVRHFLPLQRQNLVIGGKEQCALEAACQGNRVQFVQAVKQLTFLLNTIFSSGICSSICIRYPRYPVFLRI